jgi:superfamily II DNA or RNA helicase
MAGFKAGTLTALCAPEILDEGVDVPAADLAIILAASRSRRQMVQRMGRVMRRKPDGRHARIVNVYVEATNEDPATGAHELFLNEITPLATSVSARRAGDDL